MRMPLVLFQTQVLLFCFRLAAQGQIPAAHSPASGPRTVRIGGTRNQGDYVFRISSSGSRGVIEVRGGSAIQVQTLTCPLLRDETNPSEPELKAIGEQFVTHFAVEDLNFDGYVDVKAPREFGAAWGVYCVWLFDPQQRLFVKDRLASEMELLVNLEAEPVKHRIVSYSIGPTDPLRDEYRIETPDEGRPYWSRLVPVQSCFLKTGLGSERMAVLTEYRGGRGVIRRTPMTSGIESTSADVCDCVRTAVEQRKGPAAPGRGPGR